MNRRQFNQALIALGISSLASVSAKSNPLSLKKPIKGTYRKICPIGMGTWITFDKNIDSLNPKNHIEILNEFFKAGGEMIDSSPMYGYAQQLLGQLLPKAKDSSKLFAATKVWTIGEDQGIQQMQKSQQLWDVDQFDLMLIHNLLDWKTHIKTLNRWKQEGKVKAIGVSTSHGRRHSELIDLLKKHPIDFVQFSYNINDRQVENYLLPLAQEKNVSVVINRPFKTGGLFSMTNGKSLPSWASEIQCKTWSQFFLKFVISHPAVTCAIPATSQVAHMKENMQALNGKMPNAEMRKEMIEYFNKFT